MFPKAVEICLQNMYNYEPNWFKIIKDYLEFDKNIEIEDFVYLKM